MMKPTPEEIRARVEEMRSNIEKVNKEGVEQFRLLQDYYLNEACDLIEQMLPAYELDCNISLSDVKKALEKWLDE